VADSVAPAAPGVFSRKASGLVRVGNSLDVFIFNVGLVSVGIAIAYNQFYGPSLYPGAQPWISTLLAAFGMIFVAAAFYCWSVVFPRSGGVYVFLSRTINPGVAFTMIHWAQDVAKPAVQSVGIGGEVKKARRSQLFGMLGAVVATGVVIALFALLSNKVFGSTFQGAVIILATFEARRSGCDDEHR
jgi:amino acid transporter